MVRARPGRSTSRGSCPGGPLIQMCPSRSSRGDAGCRVTSGAGDAVDSGAVGRDAAESDPAESARRNRTRRNQTRRSARADPGAANWTRSDPARPDSPIRTSPIHSIPIRRGWIRTGVISLRPVRPDPARAVRRSPGPARPAAPSGSVPRRSRGRRPTVSTRSCCGTTPPRHAAGPAAAPVPVPAYPATAADGPPPHGPSPGLGRPGAARSAGPRRRHRLGAAQGRHVVGGQLLARRDHLDRGAHTGPVQRVGELVGEHVPVAGARRDLDQHAPGAAAGRAPSRPGSAGG